MGKGLQKPPEGMHLQNPEIKWKSSPIAPRSSDSIPSQLNNVGDGIKGKKTPEQSLPPPSVSLARPGPTPIPGEGGRARERLSGRPPARGCGGPRRQEDKEEAASPLARPPTPAPPQAPRGPANRMEVGAGRTGSQRRHCPGSAWPAGGGGFAPRRTPKACGKPRARRQENPQRKPP